jgi:hypothetical protein
MAELTVNSGEWNRAANGAPIGDLVTSWGGPVYLLALRKVLAKLRDDDVSLSSDAEEGQDGSISMRRLILLRQLVCDGVALQRGAYFASLPKMQRDRLAFDERKHKDSMEVLLAKPKVQERMNALRPLTDEERRAIVDTADEIMGLK